MATVSPTAGAASANKAAPKRSRLVLLLAVLAIVLAAGAALFFLLRTGKANASAPPDPPKPIFVALQPLTVNLLSDGRPKFLHIGVTLLVQDDPARARLQEVMPELRSRLLLLLSNRDPATLMAPKDKSTLAGQIRDELNRPVASGAPALGIRSVAFETFVVQ